MLSRRSMFGFATAAFAAFRTRAVAADVPTTVAKGVLISQKRSRNPDGSIDFTETCQFGPPITLIAPMKRITIEWSDKDFEA